MKSTLNIKNINFLYHLQHIVILLNKSNLNLLNKSNLNLFNQSNLNLLNKSNSHVLSLSMEFEKTTDVQGTHDLYSSQISMSRKEKAARGTNGPLYREIGKILKESDIIRLDDIYGRIKK